MGVVERVRCGSGPSRRMMPCLAMKLFVSRCQTPGCPSKDRPASKSTLETRFGDSPLACQALGLSGCQIANGRDLAYLPLVSLAPSTEPRP